MEVKVCLRKCCGNFHLRRIFSDCGVVLGFSVIVKVLLRRSGLFTRCVCFSLADGNLELSARNLCGLNEYE